MLRQLKIGGVVTACAVAMSCAGSPPDPARPALVSCTQATWETMTPRVRVGQLFLLGMPATAADGFSPVIERLAPGGVFLVGHSTAGVVATAATTGTIQRRGTSASGGVGMFVVTDQEGGQVQVLSGPGFSQIPSAKVQGRWKPEVLQAAATGWGQELRAAGLNVNLAPVADVLSPALGSANAAIGRYDRAYGTNPQDVSQHVLAFAWVCVRLVWSARSNTSLASAGCGTTPTSHPVWWMSRPPRPTPTCCRFPAPPGQKRRG